MSASLINYGLSVDEAWNNELNS